MKTIPEQLALIEGQLAAANARVHTLQALIGTGEAEATLKHLLDSMQILDEAQSLLRDLSVGCARALGPQQAVQA